MSSKSQSPEDAREAPSLHALKNEVSPDEPWQDDKLNRRKIADNLTNLIQGQSRPLTISLSGSWGTGKTFLLERWRQDLENKGVKSIYFNAWEDDFCDDPFIALIGQLSASLSKDKKRFPGLGADIKSVAAPVLRNLFENLSTATTGGLIRIDVDKLRESFANKALDAYSDQKENIKKLKSSLEAMSQKIVEETEHPLVFIIDELDRCRPTFAIELLEKVKHIFDIPNIVFVFGINREELCSSIESIYGQISSSIYLRRFFDMEFILPKVNSENFCRYLLEEVYDLKSLSKRRPDERNFITSIDTLPVFCGRLDLSLRDLDYCARSLAFVLKNYASRDSESRSYFYPFTVVLLIVLRIKNRILYRRFVKNECLASEVINYIDEIIPENNLKNNLRRVMAAMEIQLCSFNQIASEQMSLLMKRKDLSHPEYLSEKTKENPERIGEIFGRISPFGDLDYQGDLVGSISSLIELVEMSSDNER